MNRTMITLAVAGLAMTATGASAQSVAALLEGNNLAIVDVKAARATAPVKIAGAGKLVGIDVRPADGLLYGLFDDGTLVTIDPKSGATTAKSKLDVMLPAGTLATVDFNPVADRLRVIGSDGTNLRVNVDDGKVTKDGALRFAEADANKAAAPRIVAGAYTNSVKGAKETALFDIDAATGTLVKQAPPNDGVLNSVGKLGVSAAGYAFDIPAGSTSEGWLMAGGTLYRVDLASGKATAAGPIAGASGAVQDIAILPGM